MTYICHGWHVTREDVCVISCFLFSNRVNSSRYRCSVIYWRSLSICWSPTWSVMQQQPKITWNMLFVTQPTCPLNVKETSFTTYRMLEVYNFHNLINISSTCYLIAITLCRNVALCSIVQEFCFVRQLNITNRYDLDCKLIIIIISLFTHLKIHDSIWQWSKIITHIDIYLILLKKKMYEP